jgi:hypothetical protein
MPPELIAPRPGISFRQLPRDYVPKLPYIAYVSHIIGHSP